MQESPEIQNIECGTGLADTLAVQEYTFLNSHLLIQLQKSSLIKTKFILFKK